MSLRLKDAVKLMKSVHEIKAIEPDIFCKVYFRHYFAQEFIIASDPAKWNAFVSENATTTAASLPHVIVDRGTCNIFLLRLKVSIMWWISILLSSSGCSKCQFAAEAVLLGDYCLTYDNHHDAVTCTHAHGRLLGRSRLIYSRRRFAVQATAASGRPASA